MKTLHKYANNILTIMIILILSGNLACNRQAGKSSLKGADFLWTTSSEEALAKLNKGLLLLDAGDIISSREYFTKAIERDPEFAIAYSFRALSSGSTDEFVSDIESAVSFSKKISDFEKTLIQINETYINSDSDKRLELAQHLINKYPEHPRALLYYGYVLQERNNLKEAREAFSKAKEISPGWLGSYVALGTSYAFYKPTDFEMSRNLFSEATHLHPKIAYLHVNLGDAYRALDKLESASDEYSQAIELDPENWVAYAKKGHVNSFLGKYKEARSNYQEARKHMTYGNQSYIMEALTYLYEGDPDKCIIWLEDKAEGIDKLAIKSSRRKTGKLYCSNACALIAFHHNKPEHFSKAKLIRNELNTQISAVANTPGVKRDAKAENIFWDGLEAALACDYETALAKAEENKEILSESKDPNKLYNYEFLLGYIKYKQEKYTESVDHFKMGDPNWVYNQYYLAKAYQANNQDEKANPIYREVATFNFNDVGFALVRDEVRRIVAAL